MIVKVCPIGYLGAGKGQCRTWVGLDYIEKLTGCPLVNPSPPPTKSYAFRAIKQLFVNFVSVDTELQNKALFDRLCKQ